ncbi:hypothetical protein ABI59_07865 [Acidobacteria bacterium Mor1]|nr:hypothetical protein ABI59_07865 [Acidobacteria bacterium Mor1]
MTILLGTALLGATLLAAAGAESGGKPRKKAPKKATPKLLAAILGAEDRRVVDETLEACLASPDAELRRHAARAIGRIGGAGALGHLSAAATDTDAGVRAQAAFGFGLIGGQESLDLLATMTEDKDPGVLLAVARALALFDESDANTWLLKLLENPDPDVLTAACLTAGRMNAPNDAVTPLLRHSNSKSPEVRLAAIWALSRLGAVRTGAFGVLETSGVEPRMLTQIRARLVELTTSRDPRIRAMAAAGLSAPTTRTEVKAMTPRLTDPDRMVRVATIRSFGYPNAKIFPYLSNSIEESDQHLVWASIEALGRVGPSASDLLVDRIIKAPSNWIREEAIRSLNRINAPLAAKTANGVTQVDSARLRAAAAIPLSAVDTELSREIAERLRKDPSPQVRAMLPGALLDLEDSMQEALADLIADPSPRVRAAVAATAGRRMWGIDSNEETVRDALATLDRLWKESLDDPLPRVRFEVLNAARRLGKDDRGRKYVDLGLADPDRRVRIRAAKQLEEVFGETATVEMAATDLDAKTYREILRWASEPRAAVVQIRREGFRPGRFTIRFDLEHAPITSWQFAQRAEQGLYDGLEVSRVIPGELLQVDVPIDGDRAGIEPLRDEPSMLSFGPARLGMARSGPDESLGSWFITLGPQWHLDGRYTAFAHVVQNYLGVTTLMYPGDRIEKIEIYQGDGSEPLKPLPAEKAK